MESFDSGGGTSPSDSKQIEGGTGQQRSLLQTLFTASSKMRMKKAISGKGNPPFPETVAPRSKNKLGEVVPLQRFTLRFQWGSLGTARYGFKFTLWCLCACVLGVASGNHSTYMGCSILVPPVAAI